jgi:hypothetical protein
MPKAFIKFIPITKVDAAKQEVWGVVTAEMPDKDGEICDYESTVPVLQGVVGRVRQGHRRQELRQCARDAPAQSRWQGDRHRVR